MEFTSLTSSANPFCNDTFTINWLIISQSVSHTGTYSAVKFKSKAPPLRTAQEEFESAAFFYG